MTGILLRQFLRRFRDNGLQYGALLALVIVTVGIIVSLESAAYTILEGRASHADEECIEDGQFTAMVPLCDDQLAALSAEYGVTLQKNFAVNIAEGDIEYRVFAPRSVIDTLTLLNGAAPEKDGEVVAEQNFARVHRIEVGDALELDGRTYTVCGTGSIPDYVRACRLESDMAVTADTFGWLMVSDSEFDRLCGSRSSSVEYTYAYLLGDGTDPAAFSDGLYALPIESDDPILQAAALSAHTDNILSFVERQDNRRMDAELDFARLYRTAGWIAGVMMVVLLALIFSVVTRNQIRNEHGAVGSLFALGLKKGTLMRLYILPSVCIVLLGGALGMAAGNLPFIRDLSERAFHNENSFPYYQCAKPAVLYLFSLVMPPVVDLAVNICVLSRTFSHPALALLRGTYESEGGSPRRRDASSVRFPLLHRVLHERSGIIVFLGVLSSVTLFMLGLTALALADNNERMVQSYTRYNTLCVVRAPNADLETAGEKLLIRQMKTRFRGSNLTFSLVGVPEDSRFFDIPPQKGDTDAVAGEALASKLGLAVGDTLTFHEGVNGADRHVTVTAIIPTGAGMELYMPVDSLRTMLETGEDSYNALAFEDEPDIPAEQIYSVTAKEDIISGIDSMRAAISAFIILSVFSSVLIFTATLYLIVSATIDRVAEGVSLLRIFGCRPREIRQTYIHPIIVSVILALLGAIPLAKCFCDRLNPAIYEYMAVGMFYSLPFWYYIAIFCTAVFLFFIVLWILTGKVRRIPTSVVLRSRE